MSEKRSHERFLVSLPVVVVHDGREHTGTSRDVGIGGMFVSMEAPPPFGSEVIVRVTLPAMKQESALRATVRWHRREGMGIQWQGLRAREVWAIHRLEG